MRYLGTGMAMSTAPHRKRPVTVATTVGLALIAGVITLWLGVVAQLGETINREAATPVGAPTRLVMVRVEAGESLQELAARVAPGVPVRQEAERIRDLNSLDSSALTAGQALLAPIG